MVRVDKKPLEIEAMQILCDFCAVRTMRLSEDAEEMEQSDGQMQAMVRRESTREAFRVYAEEY